MIMRPSDCPEAVFSHRFESARRRYVDSRREYVSDHCSITSRAPRIPGDLSIRGGNATALSIAVYLIVLSRLKEYNECLHVQKTSYGWSVALHESPANW